MATGFRLSVAIPIHNEESVLPELLRRLRDVLDSTAGGPHEILFVDDGSTDKTFDMLVSAAKEDVRIGVISLSRNFGHQAAISAGLDHVTGDAAVVMDGDLQDVPEVIPQFVGKFHEGYEVVYAQRVRRKEPLALRVCYFLFYRMMAILSDISLPLDSGDFGLMSRRVIEEVRKMPEHHRYLRGMRSWVGFRQTGIEVERGERHSGKSKYSVMRLVKLAFDGIFAFSIVPIRAAALFGALGDVPFQHLCDLCDLCQARPPTITARIHSVTPCGNVLLWHRAVLPRRDRGVCRPHLRRDQGAARIHCRAHGRAKEELKLQKWGYHDWQKWRQARRTNRMWDARSSIYRRLPRSAWRTVGLRSRRLSISGFSGALKCFNNWHTKYSPARGRWRRLVAATAFFKGKSKMPAGGK